jgi:hypothetical protein
VEIERNRATERSQIRFRFSDRDSLGSGIRGVAGSGDFFTEVKHISIGVADAEIFHVPRARCERIEDFNACGAELGFEGFSGPFDEIEVCGSRTLVAGELFGSAEVDALAVAVEEAIEVAILPGLRAETEAAVEVQGAGEVADGEDRDNESEGRHAGRIATTRMIAKIPQAPTSKSRDVGTGAISGW